MADKIITLGKEWWTFPPEFWGSEDGPRADTDGAKATTGQPQELGKTAPIGPTLPPIADGWTRSRPRRGSDSARSRGIDQLLARHIGRGPRRP